MYSILGSCFSLQLNEDLDLNPGRKRESSRSSRRRREESEYGPLFQGRIYKLLLLLLLENAIFTYLFIYFSAAFSSFSLKTEHFRQPSGHEFPCLTMIYNHGQIINAFLDFASSLIFSAKMYIRLLTFS